MPEEYKDKSYSSKPEPQPLQPQVIYPDQHTLENTKTVAETLEESPDLQQPAITGQPVPVTAPVLEPQQPSEPALYHAPESNQDFNTQPTTPAPTMSAAPTGPPHEINKKNKKPKYVIVIATILAIVSAGVYGAFTIVDSNPKDLALPGSYDSGTIVEIDVSKAYSSPIGFLPPFQDNDITTGEYSLEGPAFVASFPKFSNSFVVNSDNLVQYKVINNIDKVNNFLEFLYTKGIDPENSNQEQQNTQLVASETTASQYASLDFPSLLGFGTFYDTTNIFGGFFTYTQQSINGEETAIDSLIKSSDSCEQSFEKAKFATSAAAINTESLRPQYRAGGERFILGINNQIIEQAFDSVFTYFDDCFDFSKPSLVEYADYVNKLKAREQSLPEMSIAQEAGLWKLYIGAPADPTNVLTITVDNLKTTQISESDIITKDFSDLNTRFGMAYDACRLPPTRLTDFGGSDYTFIAEVSSYYAPNNFDTGYVCVPSQATGYSANSFGNFITLAGGAVIDISDTGLLEFQSTYEMRYLAEQFYLQNGYYPAFDYLREEVAKIDDLGPVVERLIAAEQLTYELLPGSCTDDCNDFELNRVVRDDAKDITINLTSYSYNRDE